MVTLVCKRVQGLFCRPVIVIIGAIIDGDADRLRSHDTVCSEDGRSISKKTTIFLSSFIVQPIHSSARVQTHKIVLHYVNYDGR